MSDEEFRRLKLCDWVYRLSDGHIGQLTSAPYYYKDEQEINEAGILSLNTGYSDYSGNSVFHAKDRKNWAIFDWRTCQNPIALARYSIIVNQNTINMLRGTTIL